MRASDVEARDQNESDEGHHGNVQIRRLHVASGGQGLIVEVMTSYLAAPIGLSLDHMHESHAYPNGDREQNEPQLLENVGICDVKVDLERVHAEPRLPSLIAHSITNYQNAQSYLDWNSFMA